MAEAHESKAEGAKAAMKKRVSELMNEFKFFLNNSLGTSFHVKGVEATKRIMDRINTELNLGMVGTMNEAQVKTENAWEGAHESIENEWKAVMALYSYELDKEGHPTINTEDPISKALGPFTDPIAVEAEGKAASSGTGLRDETVTIIPKIAPDEKIVGTFSVPRLKPIHYFDGRADKRTDGQEFKPEEEDERIKADLGIAYEVAFVGVENLVQYWETTLGSEIDQICEKVADWYKERINDEDKLKNVDENVGQIKKTIKEMLAATNESSKTLPIMLKKIEDIHRGTLIGGAVAMKEKLKRAETLRSQLIAKTLKDFQIHFTHTYKVLKQSAVIPVKYKEKKLGNIKDFYEKLESETKNRALTPEQRVNIELGLLRDGKESKEMVNVVVYLDKTKNPYRELKTKCEAKVNEFRRKRFGEKRLSLQVALDKVEEKLKQNIPKKIQAKNQISNIKNSGLGQAQKDRLIKNFEILMEQVDNQIKLKWRIIYEIDKTRLKIREWQEAEWELEKWKACSNKVEEVHSQIKFQKLPWEQDIGLDENGYPLEVGDGETLFEGQKLPKNLILADVYLQDVPDSSPRKRDVGSELGKGGYNTKMVTSHGRGYTARIAEVPEEFIDFCDLMSHSTWAYVHYDSYRDDLRDARYHDCITIMDRLMTELKTPYHKHVHFEEKMKKTGELDVEGKEKEEGTGEYTSKERHQKWTFGATEYWKNSDLKQTKVQIKLNKLREGHDQWRLPTDPEYIKSIISPSHLNPAFDIRAKDVWNKHLGRVYYYDVQDDCEVSPLPTITTRGSALFILHRVIEESKYWGGNQGAGYTGVLEILERIGTTKTNGFDIGANMGRPPKYPGWGKRLPMNPFTPERG